MIKAIILFVLFLGSFKGPFVHDRCDMVELNHNYDAKGNHVYDQVIFWKRKPQNGKYEVAEWALIEERDLPTRRPVQNVTSGLWEVYYKRDAEKFHILVTSPIFRESWSTVDPERENKKKVPEELRYKLYSYKLFKKEKDNE